MGLIRIGDFHEVKQMVVRKLEIVFMDKNGKFYPLDEVSSAELAEGLEKVSKETAKRLSLQKEQR
jgi:hypothetical protein